MLTLPPLFKVSKTFFINCRNLKLATFRFMRSRNRYFSLPSLDFSLSSLSLRNHTLSLQGNWKALYRYYATVDRFCFDPVAYRKTEHYETPLLSFSEDCMKVTNNHSVSYKPLLLLSGSLTSHFSTNSFPISLSDHPA